MVALLFRALCVALVSCGLTFLSGRPSAAQKPSPKPKPRDTSTVTPQAQTCLDCGGGGTYAVSVMPDGESMERVQNTGPHTEEFFVSNDGTLSDSYTFTCSAKFGVTCVSVSPASASLGPEGGRVVFVQYNVGSTGGSLYLKATGHVSDQGWMTITAVPPVTVIPDAQAIVAVANAVNRQRFGVTNRGSGNASFNLTAVCAGTASSCTVSPATITLGGGASGPADATYQAAGPGTTGSVTLTAALANDAAQKDSGWVTLSTGSGSRPVVDVESMNPGAIVERDLCLTIAVRPTVALECGDLRLVHPLPTTRTLNKARTPTLLFNSQHAHPYPLVAANITLPGGSATLDSVIATLRFGSVIKKRQAWAGSEWVGGSTRRVAVAYDGLSDPTGVHAYTLEVVHWYNAIARDTTVSGQLTIVNRADSYFGGGWWLAGLERLDPATMLWLGGDGSVRLYQPVAANVWAAPSVDRPDTLKWDAGLARYIRYLPHGVQVRFDAQGYHRETVNRLQYQTTFSYAADTLKTITLPPTGLRYEFAHANGRLQTVTAPPVSATETRVTTLMHAGGRLSTIRDPDGTTVAFGYETGFVNRIHSRTDRRGTATTFSYDLGGKIGQARHDMSPDPWGILYILQTAESRGIFLSVDTAMAYTLLDGGRTDVADATSFWIDRFGAPRRVVDALGHETLLARGDTRWPGLVTRVRFPNGLVHGAAYDARGNLAELTDSSVSRVELYVPPCSQPPCMPGFPRTRHATTRYVWNSKWDFDSIVVRPEGDSTVMSYSPVNGNRLWQQDARGPMSRVTFGYNAIGLLETVDPPASPPERFYYDGLGNLLDKRTPIGFRTTIHRDAVGRDTLILSPTDSAQTLFVRRTIRYDRADRMVATTTVGPPVDGSVTTTLYTSSTYDAEGNQLSFSRWSDPDPGSIGTAVTSFRYDRADRRVAEVAPDGFVDSVTYDPAGNAVELLSRRGHLIRMQYDAGNRIVRRIVPSVEYADTTAAEGYPGAGGRFPLYPNCNTTHLCIPGDTATFTYDAAGNLVRADNRDARVKRVYNVNGTLAFDSLRIRSYTDFGPDSSWKLHVYGTSFSHDLNGRRVALRYPRHLAARLAGDPGVYDSVTYSYDAAGRLSSVRDVFGDEFRYAYDANARLDTVYYPLGHFTSHRYDDDSRPTQQRHDRMASSPQWYRQATMRYDGRDKVKFLTISQWSACTKEAETYYTGLGHLRKSLWDADCSYGDHTEFWTTDALGNLKGNNDTWWSSISSSSSDEIEGYLASSNTYQPATGRITAIDFAGRSSYPTRDCLMEGCSVTETLGSGANRHDVSGNVYFTSKSLWTRTSRYDPRFDAWFSETENQKTTTAIYFGAEQWTRVADKRSTDTDRPSNPGFGFPAFEEFRYDALGRRVLRRSRDGSSCADTPKCHRQVIHRFVWDGSALLAEMQYPGADAVSANDLERDTVTIVNNSSRYWGRVLYVNGSDLDQPVAVIRIGFGILTGGAQGSYDTGPGFERWGPLVIAPDWDLRGEPIGAAFYGPTPRTTASGASVKIGFPYAMPFGGYVSPNADNEGFFGSLLVLQRDGTGRLYKRNRYYDPESGRFTQEDPIGLAGGLNVYGFAEGDPVNYSDPFGLCVPWCTAIAAGVGFGAIRIVANLINDRPWHEGVAQDVATGTVLGLTMGAAAPLVLARGGAATTAMVVTRFTPVGVAVGPNTERLITMLQRAGTGIEARTEAVMTWLSRLPANLGTQKALIQTLEAGGRVLTGGPGDKGRRVTLLADGTTIVEAWNVAKGVWEVVARIVPGQ